jgi:DNA-binding MarR family transcriptional regulator
MAKWVTHINRLLNVVDIFAEQSHDFPTQYMGTFLSVSINEGCSNKDLMEMTGLSTAAVARNIQALSPYRDRQERLPGYNLVYSEVDPDDNRRRRIYLTQHGHNVLADVLEKMGVSEEESNRIAQSGRKALSREPVKQNTGFQTTKKTFTKEGQTQTEGCDG